MELLGRGIYSRHRFYWAGLDRSVEGHIILELFLEKGGHEAIRTVVRNITPGHDVVNCRRLRSRTASPDAKPTYNLSS
jgi:hypothetical protein